MSDRFRIHTRAPVGGEGEWLQVVDTVQRAAVLAGRIEFREQLQAACDQLNARERLATAGTATDEGDVIELVAEAERGDTCVGAWPFQTVGRYRWRFIAHGVTAVHHTSAAGLRLRGRVVRQRTALGDDRHLVQLVDEDGQVFASVGVPGHVASADDGRLNEGLAQQLDRPEYAPTPDIEP